MHLLIYNNALRNHIIFNILDIIMSNKAVEELENILCHNAKDYLIHERIDKCFLDKSPKFLSYFFRKCSEQFLAYQDGKCSSIIHGLVKSHMSSSNKIKSLKMLLIRGVNCNKLDGNKKSILDHLVEDNDWECIKILLDYGQNLMVSENCLCMLFKLRNKHEEIFRALFAYAIKRKVAPNLTGISDGNTFLHEIMVHEKEIAHFKKWMGFFLSFPEININALNNDGLTIFDLLLLNYKKKKCECAIKLLIKYRINKFSKIDCIQPQLFSFKSQIKKEICNYVSKKNFFSKSVLKNENLELCTSNTGLSIISSGKGFSHNYLKLKQTPLWSSAKSSQALKKSSNDSVNLVNIPNYEETEITFEVEIFDKIPQRSKPKQTHLPELAKTKKYLSSKEAIVLIKEDNNKSLPCHLKMITESKKDGYMEEETKRDSVSISKSTQQLSQESSTIESTESLEKLENESSHHIKLLNYRRLRKGSYGTSNDVLYNGHPHVDKAVNPFKGKKSNKKFFNILQLIFCNHPNKQQFLGIRYHKNTPMQGMEEKWLNKSKWYKTHLLLALYSQKKNELHTGIFIDRANVTFKSFLNVAKNNEATKLHKQDIIHHSVKGVDEALSIASNSKFFHKTQEVVAKLGQLYLHLVRITEMIGAKQQGFQVCERRFHVQILEKITMCADSCSIITSLKVLNINRTVLAQLQKALISYKLMLWTSFPVKDEIVIKYHLINFKKVQAILKNYCFYYTCALSKPKAEVTVNHVYHSFNIEVVIKYMCVSTNTTANYYFKNIELRNDNIIPQLSIKNAYFSSDISPCNHVCVIDETILQVSQRRASAVTKSFGNETSSDDKGNSSSYGGNENNTFCCCAHHTSIPPILNLKRPSYTLLNINKNLPSTSSYQRPETRIGTNIYWQQQTPSIQSLDHSNPISIIKRAALFLTAGDYGATIKVLEILDKHLLLLDEVDMAKEFGQGLANFKNLHYRAAKPCFTALFEKATNHHSTGDQALASIYLGEIEMSWAKYKDAVKHFTIAVTNYSNDNVAEKFQQTILSKSAVLVKKGHCHLSLSQIKEASNAFKLAKEVAESRQEQTRGYKLKTAKEDELNTVSALGSILQSIGDYEQSFEHYEKSLKLAVELRDHVSIGWAHGNLGNAMLGLDQKDKALDHLITAFHMSARCEGNPLAVARAVSNLGNAYQAIGNLPKLKEHYEIALGHPIYGNDLQGQGRACGNIGNIYMLLKEPVKAVHYYTETLRLSTDKNTKITEHHNRGCARFDVAECIIQGKKPNELVPATTPGSEYGGLGIKLTDEVISTHSVQETKPNRDKSAQSISESSMPGEKLPIPIYGKAYEEEANVELVQAVEVVPFFEATKSDILEAIESHEQSAQNIKSSHRNLSLLSINNSQSLYKMEETLVELGRLYQQLSRLGLMDMAAADSQEFKDALVYGEQARVKTLGELVLQKKKTTNFDLFSICTPLTIPNIYKTVTLPLSGSARAATTFIIVNCKLLSVPIIDIKYKVNVKTTPMIEKQTYKKTILSQMKLHIRYYLDEEEVKTEEPEPTQEEIFPQLNKNFLKENCEKCNKITTVKFKSLVDNLEHIITGRLKNQIKIGSDDKASFSALLDFICTCSTWQHITKANFFQLEHDTFIIKHFASLGAGIPCKTKLSRILHMFSRFLSEGYTLEEKDYDEIQFLEAPNEYDLLKSWLLLFSLQTPIVPINELKQFTYTNISLLSTNLELKVNQQHCNSFNMAIKTCLLNPKYTKKIYVVLCDYSTLHTCEHKFLAIDIIPFYSTTFEITKQNICFGLSSISLLIILTNKSLLHEGKLISLLQHDLSLIDLFGKSLADKKVIPLKFLNFYFKYGIVICSFAGYIKKKEQKVRIDKYVIIHKVYKLTKFIETTLWNDMPVNTTNETTNNSSSNFVCFLTKLLQTQNYINSKAAYITLHSLKITSVFGIQGSKTAITHIAHKNKNVITLDDIVAILINNADPHLCKATLQKKAKLDFNSIYDVRKKSDATISTQDFIAYTLGITCNSKFNNFKENCITTEELQKLYWNKSILKNTKIQKKSLQTFLNYFTEKCHLQQTKCDYNLFRKFIGSNSIEQSEDISQIPIVSIQFASVETRNANKSNLVSYDSKLLVIHSRHLKVYIFHISLKLTPSACSC